MAEMNLEARLKRLEEIFGQEVKLIEPPAQQTLTQEEAASQQGIDADVHLDSASSSEVARPSETQDGTTEPRRPDAPQKFLIHDVGPRASTQGAFDCSLYIPGQPLDANAEFCPWDVVRAYPTHYVGKTNRSHVRPCLVQKLLGNRS